MALTQAERESQALAGADDAHWKSVSGTTDIDDSAQTETSAFVLLTIAPQTGSPLEDSILDIDLAKATTGLAAVETSITLTFYVAHKVDGTNWRCRAAAEAAISGTAAAARMIRIPVGFVPVDAQARIEVIASGDVTADMEFPYALHYKARQAPTVTEVAA